MYIIEIAALENGAHRNQSYHGTVPEGWALIREDVSTLQNFPFGEVTAEKVDGVVVMTEWKAGAPPDPEPTELEPTELEQLRADVDFIAIMSGIEL